MSDQTKNPFQHTLNLPKTEFPIRANAAIKEQEILEKWEREELCEKSVTCNYGSKKFILHDGPPFSNGHIHMGHAFNIILKDIVCKINRMHGHHVPLIQGWDCHGLPIELKVVEENKEWVNIKRESLTSEQRVKFKKLCRDYAQKWIDVQREEFKALGKLADFNHPYITMSPTYEAAILRAFASFVKQGYIERKGKTVPWCASCQTVLAAAEIEYKDRKDPSLYVLFSLSDNIARQLFPYCFESNNNLEINLLVWTTTPWTLPLNRAVVLNPDAVYSVIKSSTPNQAFIVAKERAQEVCAQMGIACETLCECDSIVFQDIFVNHPFIEDLQVPVILDQTSLVTEGTACLHSAPGCGPQDYLLGVKYGLEIFSPISSDGKYTSGVKPESLLGLSVVTDGQGTVINLLNEKKKLLYKGAITHSYPHCWRCRNGLIFRATEQWFCDLQKNGLVARALEEIENIKFYPEWGKDRFYSFVSNRTEWCISRQRQWGVPIPALLCTKCQGAYIDPEMIRCVAQFVSHEGVEYWDASDVSKLISDKVLDLSKLECSYCKNKDPKFFTQEHDLLDVWFDSGISHDAVLCGNLELLDFPADLYLEASDQHRGWFQSSLLCSMVLHDQPQTRAILTHGFTVDEFKHKMSKSLGNVISPDEIVKKYSRDILRLWVACTDFTGDLVISQKGFDTVSEIYRKIRNTCRFLVSNLYDFNYSSDALDLKDLTPLDHYALAKLYKLYTKVCKEYKEYRFASAMHMINHYCTVDLSAGYLDILKDRLYVEKSNGQLRRSAQTVVYNILDVLSHLFAPVLSFLSEEIADNYQDKNHESIHLQKFITPVNIYEHDSRIEHPNFKELLICYARMADSTEASYAITIEGVWSNLEIMRDVILKSIERVRETGLVKHSLEARISIFIDEKSPEGSLILKFLESIDPSIHPMGTRDEREVKFIKDFCIVSQCEIKSLPDGLDKTDLDWLYVKVTHADGTKCPRCWQWEVTNDQEGLCARCRGVLK
jgi:isoleucyl-tRNA synthetase